MAEHTASLCQFNLKHWMIYKNDDVGYAKTHTQAVGDDQKGCCGWKMKRRILHGTLMSLLFCQASLQFCVMTHVLLSWATTALFLHRRSSVTNLSFTLRKKHNAKLKRSRFPWEADSFDYAGVHCAMQFEHTHNELERAHNLPTNSFHWNSTTFLKGTTFLFCLVASHNFLRDCGVCSHVALLSYQQSLWQLKTTSSH